MNIEPIIMVLLGPTQIGIAIVLSFILYVVCKRKGDISYHAFQNTYASLVIIALNLVLILNFRNDINASAQIIYDALHIPTIPANTWDNVPIWLVIIIGIAARDLVDYWNHRLMHTKWAWPTHAAHHSDTHVNALSLYRVHFLEIILMSMSYIILLTWLQMPEVLPFVILIQLLHGMYVHMDLPFTHGPFRLLVASPVFHRWHHADTPAAYGKNLANMIPFYDWLFGTYYAPGHCNEPMGALKSGMEDKNPFLIYIFPFQAWRRLIKAQFAKQQDRTTPKILPGE